ITDEGKYNSVTEESFSNDGSALDQTYIDKINTEVDNQFTISNLILDNNYYSIVFNQDEE
ncbi:MAG TPA: hypothetical protein PLC53_03475, partial [Bacilli bacterium]|nr:hypothetical protein [Bacilli bacterium]